jgi:hypothetical protein
MTVAVRLFISSAVFAAVLGIAYWFIAHDPAGTTLLAFMTAGLLVIAGYMIFAERDADLDADKPNATSADARGEHVGTFVLHSPAPFWIGLSLMLLMLGLVVAPAAAGLGLIALCILGALMIVRSR